MLSSTFFEHGMPLPFNYFTEIRAKKAHRFICLLIEKCPLFLCPQYCFYIGYNFRKRKQKNTFTISFSKFIIRTLQLKNKHATNPTRFFFTPLSTGVIHFRRVGSTV